MFNVFGFRQPGDPAVKSLVVAAVALAVTLVCGANVRVVTISTLAGTGVKGTVGDNGSAVKAELADPGGIARGPDGALYICDTANHRVRKITKDGRITSVAGTGEPGWTPDGALGLATKLNEPYEVRFDPGGNPVWVERLNHAVRRLDLLTGVVTTLAGNGTPGFSGDGGPANQAQLFEPHSIGFDRAGDLFICDVRNHRVRKVDMRRGIISTFAGTGEKKLVAEGAPLARAPLFGPRALDFDDAGNLWVALREGNVILKVDLGAGIVHLVAGNGKKGFAGNGGPALAAELAGPKGLCVGPDGNVYFADTENHAIRMLDVKREIIELIAGDGIRGDGPEGDSSRCRLARPHGIFVDRDGTIFIGDTEAQRIRVIRPSK